MRRTAALLLLALAGCGSGVPADEVMTTRHCSDVMLSPDLTMRLSLFTWGRGQGSVHESLVTACSRGGGCVPLLAFHHAMGPAYELRSDGTLVIVVLGGSIDERLAEKSQNRMPRHKVEVRQIMGRIERKEVERFQDGLPHRCPGEGQALIL
jgi:hypothetical protein